MMRLANFEPPRLLHPCEEGLGRYHIRHIPRIPQENLNGDLGLPQ